MVARGKFGDSNCQALDFTADRGIGPQKYSDGSELSPFVYRERLSANGANGYERCVNQNTRLRRSLK